MRHQLVKQPRCKWPSCGKFVIDEEPHLCQKHGELMLGFLVGMATVAAFHHEISQTSPQRWAAGLKDAPEGLPRDTAHDN